MQDLESPKHQMIDADAEGSKLGLKSLTPSLFWDVRAEDIDLKKHSSWLARRVLEYGDWSDWQFLVGHYGRPHLAEIVTQIRSLQPRAFAFCRVWFDLPASAFRCSRHPQSR